MLDGKQSYDPEFVNFLLFDGVIPVLAGDFSGTYQQGLWIWTRPTKMSECIVTSRLLEYMSERQDCHSIMSDRFPPGKMSEYMSDKMSECLPEYMSVK